MVSHRQPSLWDGSCATGMTGSQQPDTACAEAAMPALWRQQSARRQILVQLKGKKHSPMQPAAAAEEPPETQTAST